MLKEKYVPYTVKSNSGVEYTKYKRIIIDSEKEKLDQALRNTLGNK